MQLSPVRDVVSWSLCQYSREIYIKSCDWLSTVIPFNAVGQMKRLQVLNIECCYSLIEVFETHRFNNSGDGGNSTVIPRRKNINAPLLSNLKNLVISSCHSLQLVFTFSTLESLKQLKELTIKKCNTMKVIVEKEDEEQIKDVIFPRLKSLELHDLPNLEGFFLGINVFKWPLLEKVMISKCPQLMVFTFGKSIASELRFVHTSLGQHSLGCGLNFHLRTDQTSSERNSLWSTSLERLPWSFHNLIELHMVHNYVEKVKSVIPSIELQHLKNLESIEVSNWFYVEEVFESEALEGTTSDSQAVVEIQNLKEMELKDLDSLKYIWKGNHHGTVLKFPNLTTMNIKHCNRLKYVFTSSMVGSLVQLKDLRVNSCDDMEVIVKEEEAEELEVSKDVVAMKGKISSLAVVEIPNLTQVELRELWNLKYIWKSNDNGRTILKFPNLTTLTIEFCNSLKHVFTSSMVGSLQQLQHLHIRKCRELEVIVNVEEDESECDAKVKDIVLPCLKSLKLKDLESLKGFCLGKDNYSWPSLDTLEINKCPKITVFTNGHLNTPALHVIDTSFGRCYLEEDINNSFIKLKEQEEFGFTYE